jgi:catechol 2,3-dioxygenase-like lactoylglutathione lyase family enzyme
MGDLSLDHVIIAAADLEAASRELSAALGLRPSWRGRHPSYGTANVLFRLQNAYLELLAPDPLATSDNDPADSGRAWTGSLGRFLRERGPGLFSLAFQTPDVVATTARVRERGLPVEEPLPGTGEDLDTHAVREWVNARIPPEETRGARCFFITHVSPPDALPRAASLSAGAATGILSVVALSSETEGARRMWRDTFALAEAGASGEWRYDLGNATLVLRPGAPAGPGPDGWDSLELSTADLDATRQRLAKARLEAALTNGELVAKACGARLVFTETR